MGIVLTVDPEYANEFQNTQHKYQQRSAKVIHQIQ